MQQEVIAGLRFAPVLPVWALVVLALALAAATAMALSRRASGAAWRGVAYAVLLGWLCGPSIVRETRTKLPDIGVVLTDHTASMGIGDRAALATAARAALQADAGKLPGLELRSVDLSDSAHDGTRLFSALDRALATIPADRLAGIVAITDGQVQDVPANWRYGVPLHVLLAGRPGEIDRRVRMLQAPEFGVVGRSVTLRAVVDDLGVAHADQPATLTIRRDGDPPIVESVVVGQPHDVEIPITREGTSVVELTVDKLPGEVSTLDNRAVVAINGVRDRLRVLLVSGQPHQGERTWRRLLKSDPAVDLVHFTILRPPEKDDLTPLNELALIAFPTRELFQQKIGEFDLIILDRFQNRGILPLPYLRNIATYVRQGGALLVSVGPEFAGPGSLDDTPLQSILPAHPVRSPDGDPVPDSVATGAFHPLVTALGRRHPVTDSLPGLHEDTGAGDWGSWYRYVTAGDVHGEVLMSAADAPLLVLDHVDRGRIALLLSDQIWLWSRGHQGGGPQAELLRRTAHWLLRQPALEEESLSARVSVNGAGSNIAWTRTSVEETPPPALSVTEPSGKSVTMPLHPTAPGQSAAVITTAEPGVWRASDGKHTAYAAVDFGNPNEFADLRASAGPLAPLVRASHGSVHWLAGPGQSGGAPSLLRVRAGEAASGSDWIGLPRRDAHVTTGIAEMPLLPGWLALLLILALIVLAWWREAV